MRQRRGSGPKALSALLPRIAGKALRERGFDTAAIVTDWPAIVGELLASETVPEKLVRPRGANSGGTLHIRVNGAFATELQHLEPVMIERINGFFGYAAVARLALIQGPVSPYTRKRKKSPDRAESAPLPAALIGELAEIEDEDLRAALERLGRALRDRVA